MHSLYGALLAQHARQLTPVRCAPQTISQLRRYFEDVVLENSLNALVIESLPLCARRTAREKSRLRELSGDGRRAFFFVRPGDSVTDIFSSTGPDSGPVVFPRSEDAPINEHFVVIADARFSALLATVGDRDGESGDAGDEVIWTFEPDVVYSALEYLMARVSAEHPYQAAAFGSAVRTSMPKATSLQLTLSVTTKLSHLLQEQASREIAVNRIATAIRESLELGVILQTTVDEVGHALSARSCALRVESQNADDPLIYLYQSEAGQGGDLRAEAIKDFELYRSRLTNSPELFTRDCSDMADCDDGEFPAAIVPLVFHERLMGTLLVTAPDYLRAWQENELLLMRTVADQVTIAINHADLFARIQQQALTDGLTGCYNRRAFEMQLDRELQVAQRLKHPLSLIMLDLDRFKQLNDSSGHDAGDVALIKLAECFRHELRGADSAARFGGDEFALILPQADTEGAALVGERLRMMIAQIEVPGFGTLSASLGVATFPMDASGRADLIAAADRALYDAKRAGRNRVASAEPAIPPDSPPTETSATTESRL